MEEQMTRRQRKIRRLRRRLVAKRRQQARLRHRLVMARMEDIYRFRREID